MTAVAQLHYLPGAGSFAPHVLLEEVGVPYALVRVQRDETGQVVEPAGYLALNPSGRVPTIIWEDGSVQTESAAICLSIAERGPAGAFMPMLDDPARPAFLARVAFLTNTVQTAILRARYPQRFVTGAEHQAAVAAHATEELAVLRGRCAGWYATGADYVAGSQPRVDDVFLAMLIRWTRLTESPWWDDAVLGALFDRVFALPGAERALALEGIEARPPAGT